MRDFLETAADLQNLAADLQDERLEILARFLKQRIANPDAYVVALGETCSGKSALLNSVLDAGILPVQGVPSTGAVVEMCNDGEAEQTEYFVINRNATMEKLTENEFQELALRPDNDVSRLRTVLRPRVQGLDGLRLFDTPGYGSLVREHEEVLQDFLPNADAVIYVVSYRIGFQQNDYEFLQQVKKLTRDGIPFYLVINRVPPGAGIHDRRTEEIRQHVSAYLNDSELPVFMIPNKSPQNGILEVSEVSELRQAVAEDLNRPERQKMLRQAYQDYLDDMADMLRTEVERRLRSVEMEQEELQEIQVSTATLLAELRSIVPMIEHEFGELRRRMPRRVEQAAGTMRKAADHELDSQPNTNKNQTMAFMRSHFVSTQARAQSLELETYLSTELQAIAQQVEDRITAVVAHFEATITLELHTETTQAVHRAGSGILSRLLTGGLTQYFAAFGGAAGAGAGIANAASHALKVVGNWFGKTFSRGAHNTLKHVLAKIGLTSTKTLGALVGAAVEGVMVAADYATWKPRLRSSIGKSIDQWTRDMTALVDEELSKLESQNKELVDKIIAEYSAAFTVDETPADDPSHLRSMLRKLDDIDRRIAA